MGHLRRIEYFNEHVVGEQTWVATLDVKLEVRRQHAFLQITQFNAYFEDS
jgi:hypothetical protein